MPLNPEYYSRKFASICSLVAEFDYQVQDFYETVRAYIVRSHIPPPYRS